MFADMMSKPIFSIAMKIAALAAASLFAVSTASAGLPPERVKKVETQHRKNDHGQGHDNHRDDRGNRDQHNNRGNRDGDHSRNDQDRRGGRDNRDDHHRDHARNDHDRRWSDNHRDNDNRHGRNHGRNNDHWRNDNRRNDNFHWVRNGHRHREWRDHGRSFRGARANGWNNRVIFQAINRCQSAANRRAPGRTFVDYLRQPQVSFGSSGRLRLRGPMEVSSYRGSYRIGSLCVVDHSGRITEFRTYR